MNEYITRIIDEFNKHAKRADEIAANPQIGNLFEEGFHAFMANAISTAVLKSDNKVLKQRFAQEAL